MRQANLKIIQIYRNKINSKKTIIQIIELMINPGRPMLKSQKMIKRKKSIMIIFIFFYPK